MGPDIYFFILVFIIAALAITGIHLIWLLIRKATSDTVLKILKYYSSLILFLILGLLCFEFILMLLFNSSYFDLFDKISLESFQWMPSLAYKWMLIHRAIIIILVMLLLYLVLSKRRYHLLFVHHIRQIKTALNAGNDNSTFQLSTGVKLIAVLGLIVGSFYLVSYFAILAINLDILNMENWSFNTGFHSYHFHQITDSLPRLVFGCLLIITSVRLLYVKSDAWWITIIILVIYEIGSIRTTLYFYNTQTYGGIFNVLFAILCCVFFVVLIALIWKDKGAFRIGLTRS